MQLTLTQSTMSDPRYTRDFGAPARDRVDLSDKKRMLMNTLDAMEEKLLRAQAFMKNHPDKVTPQYLDWVRSVHKAVLAIPVIKPPRE